jgi:hypothetical protein
MRRCRKCGETKPLEDFYRHPTGREGRLARCKRCVQAYELKRVTGDGPGAGKYRATQKRYRLKVRIAALTHYGGKCACCGEARHEFLHLDHMYGGGRKHRAEIRARLDEYLRREGYPRGYRVLCANCNLALGTYGYCPHNGLHMHIDIKDIEHSQQAYDTVGNWSFLPGEVLKIEVSRMSDERYMLLVAIHELVEAWLCKTAGIDGDSVTRFDMSWVAAQQDAHQATWGEVFAGITEPGDDPRAPYHAQHLAATELEMRLAHLLGVDWAAYTREIEAL